MKIVQISAIPGALYALTEDGKIYYTAGQRTASSSDWGEWKELPQIVKKVEVITKDIKEL